MLLDQQPEFQDRIYIVQKLEKADSFLTTKSDLDATGASLTYSR